MLAAFASAPRTEEKRVGRLPCEKRKTGVAAAGGMGAAVDGGMGAAMRVSGWALGPM